MSLPIYQSSVITFCILAILSIIIIVKGKKEFFAKYSGYILFALILAYELIWIPFGLDLTDEGYLITKSWFMLHGMWKENVGLLWGTTLINGLWLSLVGEPLVLWERIGFAISEAFISLNIYIILKRYFDPLKSFLAVLIISILFISGACQTINYNNLPVLFLLISISLLLKKIEAVSFTNHFISGIFISFSIISRFTFLSFTLLPFLLFFNRYYFGHRDLIILKKQIIFSYSGIITGFVIGFLTLLVTASLSQYVDSILQMFNLISGSEADFGYSYIQLVDILKNDFWMIFSRMLIFGLLLFLPGIIMISNVNKIFKNISLLVFAYLLYIYTFEKGETFDWNYLFIALGFASIFLSNQLIKADKLKIDLIISSYFLLLFSSIGSDNGIKMVIFSGSSILAIASSFLFLEQTILNIQNYRITFKPAVSVLIIFSIILLYNLKDVDAYRERPRTELKTQFSEKSLKGIYSHPERVEVIDSLLFNYRKIAKEGATVLTVYSNPLFYYLTGTKYYLKDPWYFRPQEFQDKLKNSNPPDHFIFSKKDPRHPYWPLYDTPPCLDKADQATYDYFMSYVLENGYNLTYSNKMFDIYSKDTDTKYDTAKIVKNGDMNLFKDGFALDWKKVRENHIFTKDSIDFHSPPYSQRIDWKDDHVSIGQDILVEGETYYFEIWVKSNRACIFYLAAGSTNSQLEKPVAANTWTKISGKLKATGNSFYIITYMPKVQGDYFNFDDCVIKRIIK